MGVARVPLTLREKLRSLCGYEIWPQNRDLTVKGPQPKIVTREQVKAMEKLRQDENEVA